METNTAIEKKETDMSPKEKAFMLLAQGKRHYLVKDYFEAVGCLATACELLAEVYGEAADECGDAYFSYGKALLGLAREENGVLGDAVEERDEEEEENEQDEQEAGVEEKENSEKEESAKPENEKVDDAVADSVQTADSEAVGDGDSAEVDGDKDEDEDDAETVSNLKLAWEMLELVKIIFQRQADKDQNIELKLAEVYMYLGEIGLESENYTSAIEDINKCLEIRKKLLKTDDRCIAETLYQLGLAHSLASNFDESIKYFSEAVEVLEEKIKILEKKKDSGNEATEESKSDAFYTVDGEITEIKALLPEIKDKIQDMKDFKNETLKAIFEKRCEDQQGASGEAGPSTATLTSSSSSTESKPVSNITHLVRKKRKLDSDMSDSKRSKTESEQDLV